MKIKNNVNDEKSGKLLDSGKLLHFVSGPYYAVYYNNMTPTLFTADTAPLT